MPLVEFIAPIKSIAGKGGSAPEDLVYYSVGGRAICREHGPVRDPHSPAQRVIRQTTAQLGKALGQLSCAQARQWQALATQFQRADAAGQGYALQGDKVFRMVNMHRLLAGRELSLDVPPYVALAAPQQVGPLRLTTEGQLMLELGHPLVAGTGYWRLRLSPGRRGWMSRTRANSLRAATVQAADAYFAIDPAPQTLLFTPRYSYHPGQIVGVEILALSSDFVPGATLLVDQLEIEG